MMVKKNFYKVFIDKLQVIVGKLLRCGNKSNYYNQLIYLTVFAMSGEAVKRVILRLKKKKKDDSAVPAMAKNQIKMVAFLYY